MAKKTEPTNEFPPTVANPTAIDLSEYKSQYVHRKTGEVFGLKIAKDDPYGKTHHVKNNEHFAEMTETEFQLAFEKQ